MNFQYEVSIYDDESRVLRNRWVTTLAHLKMFHWWCTFYYGTSLIAQGRRTIGHARCRQAVEILMNHLSPILFNAQQPLRLMNRYLLIQ